MKFWQKKPPLMLIVTLGLLALLPILAILQYRWMGQVSEGERQRLQKNLKEGASKFTQDFDREMARIFVTFQTAEIDADKPAEGYAACYARWAQESGFPELIKNIYVIEAASDATGSAPALKRLNTTTKQFEASEWTEDFSSLRKRFEFQYQNHSLSTAKLPNLPKAPENTGEILQILRNDVSPVDEDLPALIIHRLPGRINKGMTVFPLMTFNYAVVTLDLDYIKTEMIPQLAARYFSGSNGLDYHLTVIKSGNAKSVVYQSDASAVNLNASFDSVANFFDVRLNEMSAVVRERSTQVIEEAHKINPQGQIAIQVFRSESANSATLPKAQAANSGDQNDVRFENKAIEKGGWQLLLTHRAGSLDTVVESARRKNLGISFGILLLMALSIAMILRSTRRAERLAHQQMEFVAGVSHELRTPLAVIRSAGENLADGVIDEGKQVKRYGQLIASEGRRLTEMVEQILEFSGIQSGRKAYELRPVDLHKVIENAITACRYLVEEGGFEIQKEIADELPKIFADEAALSRSIQNLLTNAMKYSLDNRIVKIEAALKSSDNNSEVTITVSDHGLGIASDELPHIFEPFYRGREATSAQIHGNGLGLSLVKTIIAAHDGSVSVATTPGKGSAFTIHLPVAEPAGETQALGIELAT
jgi:signal transduction histidine kinase